MVSAEGACAAYYTYGRHLHPHGADPMHPVAVKRKLSMPTADETSKIPGPRGPEIVAAPAPFGSCPLPISEHQRIVLGHGSGGKLTPTSSRRYFCRPSAIPRSTNWNDQAVLKIGTCALPSPRTRLW